MKRILLLISIWVFTTLGSQANTGWFQDYIFINSNNTGEQQYWIGGNPNYGTQLEGYNFGNVSSLTITKCDLRYWSDNQDRTGGAFYYKIMSADGNTQIAAPVEIIWDQTHTGGNDYQGLKTVTINLLPGLVQNTQYKLHIWAKSWGTSQGDNWLSNGGANYVATFTCAATTFTGSGDWTTTANWSTGIPSSTSNTIISGTAGISTAVIVNNLTIASGNSLTIYPSASLTVNGTLTNSAGINGLLVKSTGSGFGSLIESNSGVNAKVETYIAPAHWHFISPPVGGVVSGLFEGKYLQRHTEPDNLFHDILSLTDPINSMQGYALWSDATYTIPYTGVLNQGLLVATLNRSTAGINSGWNLIGNPYPSGLDWNAVLKTSLDNAIYIENAGTWAYFVNGAGIPNNNTRYIAPGQGFFVQVTEGHSSGTVSMDNPARTHMATSFFKSADITNLARFEVSGNGYADQAVVRFGPDATLEFDGDYDAQKFFADIPDSPQLYTTGGIPLAINALPMETGSVPLGLRAPVSGTYTIAATELLEIPVVAIEDTKTGIFTDLLAHAYTFISETGDNEMRFMLHFGTTSVTPKAPTQAEVYSFQKTIHVNLQNQEKGDIFIYSVTGQLITSLPSARGMNEIKLALTGNYLVKVVTKGSSVVRKVWIQ